MKKWAVVISAIGLACVVSGCSSDYVMATKDGNQSGWRVWFPAVAAIM